jgi:hypothetical protein
MTGKMAVNYVESAVANAEKTALSKETAELLAKNHLTQKEAAKLISNSIQIQAREEMASGLAVVRERMTLEMTQIVKTGGANALTSAKETIKGSLEDMLKQQFTLSLKGLLEATGKVVGTSGKEYLDNLVAGWADDLIKSQVSAMVEAAVKDAAPAPGIDVIKEGSIIAQLQKKKTFNEQIVLGGTITGVGPDYTSNSPDNPRQGGASSGSTSTDITWKGTSFTGKFSAATTNYFNPATGTVSGTFSPDGKTLVSLTVNAVSTGANNSGAKFSYTISNLPVEWKSKGNELFYSVDQTNLSSYITKFEYQNTYVLFT